MEPKKIFLKLKWFCILLFLLFCADPAFGGNPYIFRNSDGVKVKEYKTGLVKKLNHSNKKDNLGDGDIVETDSLGSADIFMEDGSIIRLYPNSLVVLEKVQGDERRLVIDRGERFSLNIRKVPTHIILPSQDVLEGTESIVYLNQDKDQMEIEAVYVNGKGFNLKKKDGKVVNLRSGEKFYLPLLKNEEEEEEEEVIYSEGKPVPDHCAGRTIKYAGKTIVLPDGVTYKLEEGKLIIFACPKHFKGPKAVKVGETIVILEKDSILTIDLKGGFSGSNLYFIYFPPSYGHWTYFQRRAVQDPSDISPETN